MMLEEWEKGGKRGNAVGDAWPWGAYMYVPQVGCPVVSTQYDWPGQSAVWLGDCGGRGVEV